LTQTSLTSHQQYGCSDGHVQTDLLDRLWLYTNLDCNLECRYCVTQSCPRTPPRALNIGQAMQIVDEALVLGFRHVYVTGGEPFLLQSITDLLEYTCSKVPTTVLTNATLLPKVLLDRLEQVANGQLTMQVSLDGATPEHNDPYRGPGTWERTVDGLKRLLAHRLQVTVSTTRTPVNAKHLNELTAFLDGLGIGQDRHLVRNMVKGGFASEGIELRASMLEPEVTVTAEGIFWHPLLLPGNEDMLVAEPSIPLADAVERFRIRLLDPGKRGKFI